MLEGKEKRKSHVVVEAEKRVGLSIFYKFFISDSLV